MNKTQLIEVVAREAGLKKKDAETAVNAVFSAVENALAEGEKVQLAGFGTFEVRERPEHQGLNPRTKEPITIAASRTAAFKPGKTFIQIIKPSVELEIVR